MAFQHILGGRAVCCPLTSKQPRTILGAKHILRSVWCMLMNVVLKLTGLQRELLHHKWIIVSVMGVVIKEVNEAPTANIKVSYLNHIRIVTTMRVKINRSQQQY